MRFAGFRTEFLPLSEMAGGGSDGGIMGQIGPVTSFNNCYSISLT